MVSLVMDHPVVEHLVLLVTKLPVEALLVLPVMELPVLLVMERPVVELLVLLVGTLPFPNQSQDRGLNPDPKLQPPHLRKRPLNAAV